MVDRMPSRRRRWDEMLTSAAGHLLLYSRFTVKHIILYGDFSANGLSCGKYGSERRKGIDVSARRALAEAVLSRRDATRLCTRDHVFWLASAPTSSALCEYGLVLLHHLL